MSRTTVFLATSLFTAAVALPAARADILDDIMALATAARDRATQARDRATEARDSVNEIRAHVREGVMNLDAELRMMIAESIDDLKTEIHEELEGRAAFLGDSGCSAECDLFRSQLVSVLEDLEMLSNLLLDSVGVENSLVDFDPDIALIRNAPGRALFPLYRVLSVETKALDSGFVDSLHEGVAALQTVQTALKEAVAQISDGSDARSVLAAELQGCAPLIANYATIDKANKAVSKLGSLLKFIGKKLSASGEKEISKQAGIHGYVHVSGKNNRRKSLGKRLDGIGELLTKSSKDLDDKMQHCTIVSTQNLLLETIETNHTEVLDNQEAILEALAALQSPGSDPVDGGSEMSVPCIDPSACGAMNMTAAVMMLGGLVRRLR